MPTLIEVATALKRHIGLTQSRTFALARRLRESGMLPSGAPGVSPVLDFDDVLDLIIAHASAVSVHKAPETIVAFKAMTPGGGDVSSAPASVRSTAGSQFSSIASLAAERDPLMRPLRLEFVSTWSEFAIHFEDGSVQRYQPLGTLPNHWQSAGHRTSTTINGATLADALSSLFGDKP